MTTFLGEPFKLKIEILKLRTLSGTELALLGDLVQTVSRTVKKYNIPVTVKVKWEEEGEDVY